MSTNGRLTIRIPKRLRAKLAKIAKQRGETESELARVALQSYLDATPPQESCYDIAKRLGIIGIMKDGPSDLSTNPKHLEGFGRD
jgi:metal-responsive CopG/Arc/MetJ family transcriptional regulator